MQFKIGLVKHAGDDKKVERGAVILIEKGGTENPEHMTLDDKTTECTVNLLPGQKLIVQAAEPQLVYDIDQKAAMPAEEPLKPAEADAASITAPAKHTANTTNDKGSVHQVTIHATTKK
jgi:hypothetical protein